MIGSVVNAGIFDIVLATFLGAINGGFNTLLDYAIPLLGALAAIMFYLTLAPAVMSGAGIGESLAECLWTVIKIGVYYYLLMYLPAITDAALQTFVQWGLAPSGAFTLGDFMLPSRLIRAGWKAAYPVAGLMKNMSGKIAPWNWPTLAIYLLAFLAIIVSFAVLAWETMVALVEYHLAVMVSPVLVPWGVLTHTGFFAEFSIAWIVGGLIRVLLMAGLMGITIGLFDLASQLPDPYASRDPGVSEAVVVALIALFFAGIAWTVPKRAASIGGRGMALALTGSDVYMPIWRAARPMGGAAIEGASRMVQSYRQARAGGTP